MSIIQLQKEILDFLDSKDVDGWGLTFKKNGRIVEMSNMEEDKEEVEEDSPIGFVNMGEDELQQPI